MKIIILILVTGFFLFGCESKKRVAVEPKSISYQHLICDVQRGLNWLSRRGTYFVKLEESDEGVRGNIGHTIFFFDSIDKEERFSRTAESDYIISIHKYYISFYPWETIYKEDAREGKMKISRQDLGVYNSIPSDGLPEDGEEPALRMWNLGQCELVDKDIFDRGFKAASKELQDYWRPIDLEKQNKIDDRKI